MEDIRIGRQSVGAVTYILCNAGLTRILGFNKNRIAFTVAESDGLDMTIQPGPGTSSIRGLALNSFRPQQTVTLAEAGSLVTGEWYLFNSGGAAIVTVLDVTLEKE